MARREAGQAITLNFPQKASATKVFRLIVATLRNDRLLTATFKRMRAYEGTQADLEPFGDDANLPECRFSHTSSQAMWQMPNQLDRTLNIVVEIATLGLCLDDPSDLFEYMLAVLFRAWGASGPDSFRQLLQQAGAQPAILRGTQPAFVAKPDQGDAGVTFASGVIQIQVPIKTPSL